MNTKTRGWIMCLCFAVLSALSAAADNEVVVNLDTSEVPELARWGQDAKTLVEQWYPRFSHLLASKDYQPVQTIQITLRKSDRGIADTAGNHIRVYSGWIQQHPEDLGLVAHELVHAIQGYPHGAPGWLTEGIADYLRWAIYEGKPQSWFDVPDQPNAYTQGYRVCGGFLLWLESDRAPGIVKKLNKSLRERKYDPAIFQTETGLPLDQLWKTYAEERKQLSAVKKDQ